MKQYGFTGKGTGKLGSAIFAISGGEQIVRQYNPVVSNPQTEAQVAQRAKFKLLTQLAAAMSGQIAFRKSGLTSARNKFVSYNIKNATFNEVMENSTAEIAIATLSLTGSQISLPYIHQATIESGSFPASLDSAASDDVSRIVYIVFRKTDNDKISVVTSQMVSDAGNNRTFPATLEGVQEGDCIFAYGILDKTSHATAVFENYVVNGLDDTAIVNVFKKLSYSDYALTETKTLSL